METTCLGLYAPAHRLYDACLMQNMYMHVTAIC